MEKKKNKYRQVFMVPKTIITFEFELIALFESSLSYYNDSNNTLQMQ